MSIFSPYSTTWLKSSSHNIRLGGTFVSLQVVYHGEKNFARLVWIQGDGMTALGTTIFTYKGDILPAFDDPLNIFLSACKRAPRCYV
jgi:hypothetical protein